VTPDLPPCNSSLALCLSFVAEHFILSFFFACILGGTVVGIADAIASVFRRPSQKEE